jgi:hypothetical protein
VIVCCSWEETQLLTGNLKLTDWELFVARYISILQH